MNAKNLFTGFFIHFLLVFIVSAGVSYLYGLAAHGHGGADWRLSFQLASILGISLPLAAELNRRKK